MRVLDTLTRPGSVSGTDPGLVLPRGVRLAPVVAVVVAVGVLLRCWSFSPLWLDEAQSVSFARLPLADLPDALRIDGAPPLYYVLLHFWIDIFGDGPWAARSISMFTSVAALPLMWLLVRRLGGDTTTAAVAVLLLAANPWAIHYAGEARMYSLVVLEVLVLSLALLRLRRRPEVPAAVGLALVTTALLYTHYWAMFLLVTLFGLLMLAAWRRPAERAFAGHALVAVVAGGVAFLPWVSTMLYQTEHTGAPWAPSPSLGSLAILPSQWYGGDGPAGRVGGVLVIVVLALAVFSRRQADGVVVLAVRPSGVPGVAGALLLGTLLVALLVSVVGDGAVVVRYTAVVVPMLIVLLAFGVRQIPGRAGTGVLAALLVVGLSGGVTEATTPHTQAGRVADVLNENVRKGDLIVYCPDQLAPAVEERLTLSSKVNRMTLPSQPDPRIVDWTDYTQRLSVVSPRSTASRITSYLKNQPEGSVWMVSSRSYGGALNGVCDPMKVLLIDGLGVPTVALNANGRGLENAIVERFTR